MAKKKDPFVNYTTKQIFASESMLYVLQVGKDVFEANGQWFFVERAATSHYNRILKILSENIKCGTPREKRRANKILPDLRILPLRMH